MKRIWCRVVLMLLVILMSCGVSGCYFPLGGGLFGRPITFYLNEDGTGYVVCDITLLIGEEEIVVPSTYQGLPVVAIESGAFSWCDQTVRIMLPDTIEWIGDYAFSSCSALEELTIPASVTAIGVGIVEDCTSLKTLQVAEGNAVYSAVGNCLIETQSGTLIAAARDAVIPDDGRVKRLATDAFSGHSMRGMTIPEGVTIIEEGAFMRCEQLETILLPQSLKRIGAHAFNGCSQLRSVDIPDGVIQIGSYAFEMCERLERLRLGKGLVVIDERAFALTAIAEVHVPSGVEIMGEAVFEDCSRLIHITCGAPSCPTGWDPLWRGNGVEGDRRVTPVWGVDDGYVSGA